MAEIGERAESNQNGGDGHDDDWQNAHTTRARTRRLRLCRWLLRRQLLVLRRHLELILFVDMLMLLMIRFVHVHLLIRLLLVRIRLRLVRIWLRLLWAEIRKGTADASTGHGRVQSVCVRMRVRGRDKRQRQ